MEFSTKIVAVLPKIESVMVFFFFLIPVRSQGDKVILSPYRHYWKQA